MSTKGHIRKCTTLSSCVVEVFPYILMTVKTACKFCGFVLQDQFALALSQAVGSAGGKKEDELVGSKLNKVQLPRTKMNPHSFCLFAFSAKFFVRMK